MSTQLPLLIDYRSRCQVSTFMNKTNAYMFSYAARCLVVRTTDTALRYINVIYMLFYELENAFKSTAETSTIHKNGFRPGTQ